MVSPEDALVRVDHDQSFHIEPLGELGQFLTNGIVETGRGNRGTPLIRIKQTELIHCEGEAKDRKATKYRMSTEVIERLNVVLRIAVVNVEL